MCLLFLKANSQPENPRIPRFGFGDPKHHQVPAMQEFIHCKLNNLQFPRFCFSRGNFSVRKARVFWEKHWKQPDDQTKNSSFVHAFILGCFQLAPSKEFSPSSTWWQKGHLGPCCGHRVRVQGDRDCFCWAILLRVPPCGWQ